MTAETFYIKSSYRARTAPEHDPHFDGDSGFRQPDVYRLAIALARQYGCRYIIDVGCGYAQKLAALYPEFQIVGMDSGRNLAYCRQRYPHGEWIEVDLENGSEVQIPTDILRNAVVVNSDVIEHLANPSFLLGLNKWFMGHAKVALIATPERDLMRGADDNGPPANPGSVREWNLDEFELLLNSADLRPAFCGFTMNSVKDRELKTVLAVIPGVHMHSRDTQRLGVYCSECLSAIADQRDAVIHTYAKTLSQLRQDLGMPPNDLRQVAAPSPLTAGEISQITLLETGTELINAALYTDAFDVLTNALQEYPDNPEIVFQLGRLAQICNMGEDAKEFFYQAALRSPEIVKKVVDVYLQLLNREPPLR